MDMIQEFARIALTGAGATAVMDAGGALQKRMGLRAPDYALVGRWVGRMPHGDFAHDAIARAPAVPGERALGWGVHYAVGIAFAFAFVAIAGTGWLRHPQIAPALAFGAATVALPLFVMQPAMGAGFAGSRTPSPLATCARSLVNHIAFGAGLYAAAAVIDAILRLL
ncbi:MAG: DUF2938 family protein [Burkholderiales bacterium]